MEIMTISKQKKDERFFVEQFVEQIGWEYKIDNDEKPDLGIQFAEKKVQNKRQSNYWRKKEYKYSFKIVPHHGVS